jgi:hypothetical protein
LNISIDFRETRQKISGLAVKRHRKAKECFNPDLASVLLDEVDLRPMQSRGCRERFLR